MKKLINPTTHFFQQAEKKSNQVCPQIQKFVESLINIKSCELCKNDYDIFERIPRILIHCGHSFCTPCLQSFFQNRRVRCPMCLKLVKQLDSMERLPINHTIFTHLIEQHKKKAQMQKTKPLIKDAQKFLFSQFERVQKQAHRLQNPQKYDDQSGLPFCVFHQQRVEHFFCQSHSTFGCRVCIQIGHQKADCQVVDLYTVQNPQKYQVLLQQRQRKQNMNKYGGANKSYADQYMLNNNYNLMDQNIENGSQDIQQI